MYMILIIIFLPYIMSFILILAAITYIILELRAYNALVDMDTFRKFLSHQFLVMGSNDLLIHKVGTKPLL